MNGPTPLTRDCSQCGEVKRCRYTGVRWICDQCWTALFPRGEAA